MENFIKTHGKIKKSIQPKILRQMKHSDISKNYQYFQFLWLLSYIFLASLSIIIMIHFYLFYNMSPISNNFYMFNGIIICISIVFNSVMCLKNFYCDQSFKNCQMNSNIQLIISLLFTIIILWYSPAIFSEELLNYLNTKTYSNFIMNLLLWSLVILIIFNFKMKEFFDEYESFLPIKFSLIPDYSDKIEGDNEDGYSILENN